MCVRSHHPGSMLRILLSIAGHAPGPRTALHWGRFLCPHACRTAPGQPHDVEHSVNVPRQIHRQVKRPGRLFIRFLTRSFLPQCRNCRIHIRVMKNAGLLDPLHRLPHRFCRSAGVPGWIMKFGKSTGNFDTRQFRAAVPAHRVFGSDTTGHMHGQISERKQP